MLEDDKPAGSVPLTRHEQLSTSTASAVTMVSAPQATLEVTTLADTIDAGDGLLSLREAIIEANGAPGADTITFADSIRGGTIELVAALPSVTDDLVVDGDPQDRGSAGITVRWDSGDPAGFDTLLPILAIDGASARFEDLTLEGYSADLRTGIEAAESDVTLERMDIAVGGNQIADGIISRGGTLQIVDSYVRASAQEGGTILGFHETAVTIDRSRLTGSSEYGFGISGSGTFHMVDAIVTAQQYQGRPFDVSGTLVIESSAFIGNDGGDVAHPDRIHPTPREDVISMGGDVTIVNSTFAGTEVSDESPGDPVAGLYFQPDAIVNIVNSTFTGTSHRYSPAVVGIRVGDGSIVTLANSIVDDSIQGTIVSNGANTFRATEVDGAVAGDRLGVSATDLFAATEVMGPSGVSAGIPTDNGGPTPTVALLDSANNPALDSADPADAPTTDQRGYLRSATPDIGAFELDGVPPTGPDTLPPLAEKVPLPDSEIHGAPLFLVGPSGDAEVAFVDEVAAFQSSLGVYLVGPDGTIGATSWAFERIEHADASADASASARPGGGPLAPGDAVQLSDLFDPADLTPGTGFGLFLVADGWALNDAAIFQGGSLEFRSNGDPATVTDTAPDLVHIAAGGGETLVLGNILHTIDAGSPNPLSNTLNPGGTGQVTSGLQDGAFTVAFEDKPLGGNSDRDFNDALFAVEPLVTAEDVVPV